MGPPSYTRHASRLVSVMRQRTFKAIGYKAQKTKSKGFQGCSARAVILLTQVWFEHLVLV